MRETGSRMRHTTAVIAVPAALAVLAGCGQLSSLMHPSPAHGSSTVQTAPPPQPDATSSQAAAGTQSASPSATPAPVTAAGPTQAAAPTVQAGAPSSSGFFQYHNRRFDFSFNVPDGYTEQPPPEDGDGRGFTDGTATITGFGQNYMISPGMTSRQDLAGLISNYQSDGDTITYQTAHSDLAAVSGVTSQGQVFYQRDIVYPQVTYSLVWHYPYADKAQYDPLVDYTATTFTPGPDHTG